MSKNRQIYCIILAKDKFEKKEYLRNSDSVNLTVCDNGWKHTQMCFTEH